VVTGKHPDVFPVNHDNEKYVKKYVLQHQPVYHLLIFTFTNNSNKNSRENVFLLKTKVSLLNTANCQVYRMMEWNTGNDEQ